MVGHAIKQAASPARGARPFDPTRDLNGVAHLLEEAFRQEHTFPLSSTPLLRELGVFLWTMSFAPVFPETISGFVWMEEGRIVGNVTMSADQNRTDRYLISNVAVKSEYRRRGIARALMETTLEDLRRRAVKWVLLNVRPSNMGAIKLYQELGFEELEMRGEWTRPASPALVPAPPPPNGAEPFGDWVLRPARSFDARAISELVRAATPPRVLQFRAPRTLDMAPDWQDRATQVLVDLFTGQVTRRCVLEQRGWLAAALTVHGRRLGGSHRIAAEVHPDFRGRVETDLVRLALGHLAGLPSREIRAAGVSTHPEWIRALEREGFVFLNGLTCMARTL